MSYAEPFGNSQREFPLLAFGLARPAGGGTPCPLRPQGILLKDISFHFYEDLKGSFANFDSNLT